MKLTSPTEREELSQRGNLMVADEGVQTCLRVVIECLFHLPPEESIHP